MTYVTILEAQKLAVGTLVPRRGLVVAVRFIFQGWVDRDDGWVDRYDGLDGRDDGLVESSGAVWGCHARRGG